MKKEKVCLVFPPHMRIDAYYVTPPLGLLSIAAALEKKGIDVSVVDLIFAMRSGVLKADSDIYDNSVKMIMDTNPTIVGLSTQCVTYPTCINIAKRLKSINPELKIIFGGHNSSFLDKETLESFSFVDYVCRGEGEVTIPNLVDAIMNETDLDNVKGITYRKCGAIIRNEEAELIANLDDLPFPAYHLVNDMDEYKNLGERMTVLLESGRGCVFNCIFCSNCLLWQRKVRYKSIPKLIQEIKQLEKFHPDEYYIVHDFFTYDEKYVVEFCKALHDNNLKIRWNCRCRLNISKDTLNAMKQAGCERLLYGVESGSEKVLKIMNKKIKFESVYESIRNTIECGIIPSLSFVVGIPGELMEDLGKTLHLILLAQMIGNCYPFMQIISPLPGTQILENYSKDLYLWKENAFSRGIEYDDGVRMPEDLELIKNYPMMFSSFYNIKPDVPLDYLSEISKVYCIIIEMFSYSYYMYCNVYKISEIEFYNRWSAWVKNEKEIKEIEHLSKRKIWELFDEFISLQKDVSKLTENIYKYMHARYKLLISEEVDKREVAHFDINIHELLTYLKQHKFDEYKISLKDEIILFCKEGFNIKSYRVKPK